MRNSVSSRFTAYGCILCCIKSKYNTQVDTHLFERVKWERLRKVSRSLSVCVIITVMSGTIDISQLKKLPEPHEFETAKFLADRGKDIVFILPSNIPGNHRPDILMDGSEWEMKSPKGDGRKNIERNMHNAALQGHNIIMDMRRSKLSDDIAIPKLEKEFKIRSKIKCMIIITKSGDLLEYS